VVAIITTFFFHILGKTCGLVHVASQALWFQGTKLLFKKISISKPLRPHDCLEVFQKPQRIVGFHEKSCQLFDSFLRNFHGQGKLARDQTLKGSNSRGLVTSHFFCSWYSKRLVAPWAKALVGLYRSWFQARMRKLWPHKVRRFCLKKFG
jgi:hypothetical protein